MYFATFLIAKHSRDFRFQKGSIMRSSKMLLASALLIALTLTVASSAFAVSSATFVFDFLSDPGDNADGPEFNVTGIGPINDGSDCDAVVMLMVDATGTPTDIDEFCLDLITGLGSDDGDYGSANGGYTPVTDPITYALYDLTAANLTALSGVSTDLEYFDYVVANAVCLDEQFLDEPGIPNGTPYSLCGGGPVAGGACGLRIPAGSVVGELPLGGQAYYAPGQAASGVILNPGTYIVVGQDASESYYKIVLACQFLWVDKGAMQPSYVAPQNGQPLPTGIVS